MIPDICHRSLSVRFLASAAGRRSSLSKMQNELIISYDEEKIKITHNKNKT